MGIQVCSFAQSLIILIRVVHGGQDSGFCMKIYQPNLNSADKTSVGALALISTACTSKGKQLTLENHLPQPPIRGTHKYNCFQATDAQMSTLIFSCLQSPRSTHHP